MCVMEHNTAELRYQVRADELQSLLRAQGRRKDWLAARAGLHPSMVSHLIARRRTASASVAERMAEALQVPVFLLFDVSARTKIVRTGESEDAA